MMRTKSRLGWAVKAAVAASLIPLALQVSALEYELSDDLKVGVDTTLTYGRQWRVDGRDKNLMGGHLDANRAINDTFSSEFKDYVQRVNSDDGTRNFDKWDTTSNRFSAVTDIDISYQNVGLFVRPQIVYDSVPEGAPNWSGKYLPNRVGALGDNNELAGDEINSVKHFSDGYRDSAYEARFLDVYAYGTFDIDGHNLEVRAGRQVISWGEALMLQGGIAFAQNPNDANAATAPGVELKEIFLPTGAIYGSFAASENVTLEAYWQYEWIPSTLFPTGSFFEMQDFIAGDQFIALPMQKGKGFARNEHEPNNNKQFGLGMRYLLGEGTEAAVYIVNYTDKYPMFWAGNGAAEPGLPFANLETNAYGINYFDNIRMYGLTLNTVVEGVQVGVEYAYRANAPIVPACGAQQLLEHHCKDTSYYSTPVGGTWPTTPAQAQQFANAATFSWPSRAEIHTLNTGITYIFQPNPLWDTATLVSELGAWYIGGFEDNDLQFAHLGAFSKYGEGMSAQFMPEYKNVMEGVDLTIPFFVNYGIDGSMSTFNYNEHNLWWSVGAEFQYLEHWKFAGYYNDYSGENNLWVDRDNVSLNVKYIF
ncbi:MAG TPA: DUF1302 family protein [Pseudomonadales bacterium]|nr:DUF1302 family protein [Pseudomonadales bacterium]